MSNAISYLYFNMQNLICMEHRHIAPCYPLFTTSFTARLLENCLCFLYLLYILFNSFQPQHYSENV